MKYNIWCEIKKEILLLIVLGIVIEIISFYIGSAIGIIDILFFVVSIIYIFTKINKYTILKKHGRFIQNIPYKIEKNENNEEVLYIYYSASDSFKIEIFKRGNWKDTPKVGTTDLIIDVANPKKYYIFSPKANKNH